jgi:hypothetical protein
MSMIPILFKDIIQAIIKWWKRIWFEAKLKAKLDMIELENRIESELEREKANQPIYTEKPIDPELQTGESQKLGGEMRLTAPWYTDELQPPNSDGMP